MKMDIVCFVGLFGLITGCGSPVRPPLTAEASAQQALIVNAEAKAQPPARQALSTLPGGCWDYLNAGFDRAGLPEQRRQMVFSGDAKAGPYADPATFLPGDWLYYVNHSYGDIEHSGVFVDWTDYARSEGLVLSYAGEQRNEPGRYKVYDLSHVYRITRAQ